MSTNTTTEYWAVDGVSLQTHAQNIVTWGADRQAPPPLRGSNVQVPFRTGQVWVPKVPDSRTISLGMWVQGCNPDGTIPKNLDQQKTFRANWEALRSLLWQPYRQFTLSKRITYADGSLQTANALAQYSGGLSPEMHGGTHAAFTVDLLLADPYFYGPSVKQSIGGTTTFTALGDARTSKINITINGSRTNPKVTLNTTGSDPYVQYNGVVSSGDSLVLDVDNSIATYNSGSSSSTRTGLVINDNAYQWLYLDPGSNKVTVSSTAGTGALSLSYQPAFL